MSEELARSAVKNFEATVDTEAAARSDRTFKVWMEGAILVGRYFPGVEVTLEDAHSNCVMTAGLLAGGPPRPLLVDLRAVRSVSAEARAYCAGPEGRRNATAVGILIGSPLSRAIGNIYMGFNPPLIPTRLFTNEAEAKRWLRDLAARRAMEAA